MLYCSSVWSNTTLQNINRLQFIQKFASKIVTDSRKFEHVTPLLWELNWLPVKEQLFSIDSVLTFKCQNDLAPQYLMSKFTKRSNIHTRNTLRGTLCRFRYTERLLASAHFPTEGLTHGITCIMNLGKVHHWHLSSVLWKAHYWDRHFLHKL